MPSATLARPKLAGRVEPRLFTEPLRHLTRKTSAGFGVIDFANAIGEPLLPWQEWLVKHAMELNPDGTYRFRVVLVLVARQNGKSTVKRTVSLWRLYMDGARLVLGAAQDMSIAKEQWRYCIDTITACPDLKAELDKVSQANGDEWFRVASGGRYKITAANSRAGRGLSADEVTFDELRTQNSWDAWSALSKTVMARQKGQIWCMSNAGDDNSVVLNQLRDSALAGRDPSVGIFEWSAPDGCELDDEEAWCQANPGLGTTIHVSAIRSALGTDPPNVFRTEVLCQRVDQLDGAIDLAAWRDCGDPGGTMDGLRDSLAAGFDVSPDGQHATLAVAALMDDGRVRTEIAGAWNGVDAARKELPELLARVAPRIVAWYPAGPGAGFAPILRAHPGSIELTGMKAAEACQGLADLATARMVRHNSDPLLDSHLAGAQKKPAGDGWRFTRSGGHCDAAYAAAAACYQALTMPPDRKASVRVIAW